MGYPHGDMVGAILNITKVAPFGSSDITATAGAGAWNPGTASANILVTTTRIIIAGICVDPNAADQYDVEIIDTAGTPNTWAYCHVGGISAPDSSQFVKVCSGVIPSGTTLKARVQSSTGGNTIGIKIAYKELP